MDVTAAERAAKAMPAIIYGRSHLVAALLASVGPEFDDLRSTVEDIGKSTSVTNASAWALELMEAEAGIPALPDASDADRRARLRAAGWRASGTATPARIRELAATWQFGAVEITEDYADYTVTLKFVSIDGEPADLAGLQRAMRRVIPANLAINYAFTWFTWGDLRALGITWEDLRILDVTWAELGVYHTILFTDTFEAGVGDWAGVSATVTQSSEQARTGDYSLKVVTDDANPTEGAIRNGIAVVAEQEYRFTAWVYGPATTMRIAWDENDSGASYLRTKSTTAAIPADTWTQVALEDRTGADAATINAYVVPNAQDAVTYYLDNPRIRRV